ncbi:MAG: hypothetical protein MJE66_15730 [Proteobacteria bacterium]|nr:hypothetical protein [Pseudomonadota bacterium]
MTSGKHSGNPLETEANSAAVAAAGADVGATLAKLAFRGADGRPRFELHPSADLDAVVERIRALGPARIGTTGGGAVALARRLALPCEAVHEFEAWGRGARELLPEDAEVPPRHLLVALGTGTSVLLIEGEKVTRVGGTALGGGTVLGMGAAILQETDFERLCALARAGARRRVDLMVSDINPDGAIPLPGDLTAAAFGKLARGDSEPPAREDLAAGIMGLVAENVALICGGLAARTGVGHVVFGGSTLRNNPSLVRVLCDITTLVGHRATRLEFGEFAGALGALRLAESRNA